jgi:hypothetical protein
VVLEDQDAAAETTEINSEQMRLSHHLILTRQRIMQSITSLTRKNASRWRHLAASAKREH